MCIFLVDTQKMPRRSSKPKRSRRVRSYRRQSSRSARRRPSRNARRYRGKSPARPSNKLQQELLRAGLTPERLQEEIKKEKEGDKLEPFEISMEMTADKKFVTMKWEEYNGEPGQDRLIDPYIDAPLTQDDFRTMERTYVGTFDFSEGNPSPFYLLVYENAIPATLTISVEDIPEDEIAETILIKYQEHLLKTENDYFAENMSDRTKVINDVLHEILSRYEWWKNDREDNDAIGKKWEKVLGLIEMVGMQQRYVRHLVLTIFGHRGHFWRMIESSQVKKTPLPTRRSIASFLGYILAVYVKAAETHNLVRVANLNDLVKQFDTADKDVTRITLQITDTLFKPNPISPIRLLKQAARRFSPERR